MESKPSGFVTFLFTDIEGSSKLSQQFPDTIQITLEKHHSIIQKAVDAANGFTFRTVGDAFCCAFQNAYDAVAAAVSAQMILSKEEWNGADVKVRMGIHGGEAEWNGTDYMGYITLVRTSRLMAAANGEQILISDISYDKFKKNNDNELSFKDLGERRLKDVIKPIKLFQIISPGLREDFPPLKTLDARPNNLPIQLTSFIGREEVMKEIKKLLTQNRLLTVIGTGGAGKTRLAMQAGADMIDEFANGVFITELAPVTDEAMIVQTILNSLRVKEEPEKTLQETLINYLKDKELLFILDNCEHLINECAHLSEILLSTCPHLKIIATSRESLNCSGEQTYRLPSLSLPDSSPDKTPEALSRFESVRLFIERALIVDSNFRITNDNAILISDICSRLDGIPLAIELAAARIKLLSIEKIYQRLGDSFNLLTGGRRTALPRQQTLRALIDWSYDLLSENEKMLWRKVSVFTGGWTLESAEEICSGDKVKTETLDLLDQLSEKSIIMYDAEKERYRILETIKQYGEEKLKEANENEEMVSKHLGMFLDLSLTAEKNLVGNQALQWLEKLETEHGNLQSAIIRSVNNSESEEGIKLAVALEKFWNLRGYYSTGRRLLDGILVNAEGVDRSLLAKALQCAGSLTIRQGEYEKARKFYKESLKLRVEIGDKQEIALALTGLGNIEMDQGNYEGAENFFNESLSLNKQTGDKSSIANSLMNIGNVNYGRRNFEKAKKYYEESLVISRETGEKNIIASLINNFGTVAFYLGNFEEAQKYLQESILLKEELGDKYGVSVTLRNMGTIAMKQGDNEQAQKYLERSLSFSTEVGDKRSIAITYNNLGNVAIERENFEQAHQFYEQSLTLFREVGDKSGIAFSLTNLGSIAFNQLNYELSQIYYEESLSVFIEIGDNNDIAETLIGLAGILSNDNDFESAVKLLGAVEALLSSAGRILETNENNLLSNIVDRIKVKISVKEFSEYFEQGKKLTVEEAVGIIKKDVINKTKD